MKKLIKLFTSPNSIPIIITKDFTIIPFMKKSKNKYIYPRDRTPITIIQFMPFDEKHNPCQ